MVAESSKTTPQFLNLRFNDGRVSVLVETKQDFMHNLEASKERLAAYVRYEREISGNKIIAILANTNQETL